MDIEYISDTGSRHEWQCVHCDVKYLVTYHYLDGAWSVQRMREDGEREILDRTQSEQLLREFPRDRALQRARTETTVLLDQPRLFGRSGRDANSVQATKGEGPLDLGADRPDEELDDSDSDATKPSA